MTKSHDDGCQYRKALKKCVRNYNCMCGGLFPGDWRYEVKRFPHVNNCPEIIARKVLGGRYWSIVKEI